MIQKTRQFTTATNTFSERYNALVVNAEMSFRIFFTILSMSRNVLVGAKISQIFNFLMSSARHDLVFILFPNRGLTF